MFWTDPSIDVTGTLDDLRLAPLTAHILGEALLRIHDPGLRALLTTALLSTQPNRIRADPDRSPTGYHLPGGRSLRAAVMVRALVLLDGPKDPDATQRLIAAAILGNLVPAGNGPEIRTRHDWLETLVDREREHLAEWGCDRSRARGVIDLSVIAAHRHIDLPKRISGTLRRMAHACKAAAIARPMLPHVLCGPAPLPAWMDPHLPRTDAIRLFTKDTSRSYPLILAHDRRPVPSP